MRDFELEPFRPRPSLRNPHLQTLCANVLRTAQGVSFVRQRIDTPDGDFLELDIAQVHWRTWAQLGEDAPIVLALHGLEGHARRGYMCETYRQLAERGIRAVGLNYRTCGGRMNRTWQMYNAGTTADVVTAMKWLEEQYPDVPKGLVGFSLGGNVLMKYVGEQGHQLPQTVRGAVAISPPLRMYMGVEALARFPGRLYGQRLLRSLHGKVRQKRAVLAGRVDVARILATRSLSAFDELATAPLYGYDSADDYYRRCSAARFLDGVARPLLILRAVDDPMIDRADIPHEQLAAHPLICTGLTAQGGHVGFMEGSVARPQFWAERQGARFLELAVNN